MKKAFIVVMTAFILLFSGCSFRDGIYVEVKPEFAELLRKEMSAFVRARSFQFPERLQSDSAGFFAVRMTQEKTGLFALFQLDGEKYRFFLGKGNTRDFSAEERAIVDECAALLTTRSQHILRGSVSQASATQAVREAFRAKIK